MEVFYGFLYIKLHIGSDFSIRHTEELKKIIVMISQIHVHIP